jgi:geranylgeranyl diphosphate synthase type I
LETRKKSLPVVYGLERSAALARAYAQPHPADESIMDLARALDELGAQAYTLEQARMFTEEAFRHLEAAQPAGAAGAALRELTHQLLKRKN